MAYIPQTVVFFLSAPHIVTKGKEHLEVFPAFPISGKSRAHEGLAKSWARGGSGTGEGIEIPNEPKSGYRLLESEAREQGGWAWKVVTPEGYLVDLRHDVFLPILFAKGIPASGIIPAKLQWGMNGSQLRLEEVGSAQHARYDVDPDEAEARRKELRKSKVTLKAQDLIVNHVYDFGVGKRDSNRLYLGRVRYLGQIRTIWIELPVPWWHSNSSSIKFNQQWFDEFWNKSYGNRKAVMATKVNALKDTGYVMVPPKDWWAQIQHWERGDGLPVGDLKGPFQYTLQEPLVFL